VTELIVKDDWFSKICKITIKNDSKMSGKL
jgi:hypothetical protein